MPKKKLNLLQFAAGGAAKPSATSTAMPHWGLCRIDTKEARLAVS